MRPHFSPDLGVPVPVVQMERRAVADARKPETWIEFEAEFCETPFLQLVELFADNEERA